MPKLIMVSDYIKNPTHAGNYLAYMSRQGDLICHNGNTTLAESMSALEENQESIMWRQVVSLEREDCERLNLDHDYFMNLIVARSDEIAKIYNISPENLKIYASFHNKDYHPHLHMLFYSTNKNEGFIKGFAEDKERGMKQATTKLKSLFANEIFKEDLHYLKVNKSSTRTLMNEQVKEILQGMTKNEFIPKELVQEYKELSGALKLHFVENPTQRKVYMYLPQELKTKVDTLLNNIVNSNKVIFSSYEQYLQCQRELLRTYADNRITVTERMSDYVNRFFHPHKGDDTRRHNLIIESLIGYKDENRSQANQTGKEISYRPKSTEEAVRSLTWGIANNIQTSIVKMMNEVDKMNQEPARYTKKRTFKREKDQEHPIDH